MKFHGEKGKKIILGVIGAIVIGALGSGLWNAAMAPTLSVLSRGLLTLLSLVFRSISNRIYTNVARGFHEEPSLTLLGGLTGVVLGVCVTMAFISFYLMRARREGEGKSGEGQGYDRAKKVRRARIMSLVAMCLATFMATQMIILGYTNRAITHFRQSFTICKPFIDDQDEDRLLAQFAMVTSKQDYVSILEELRETAKENGQELPEFSVW